MGRVAILGVFVADATFRADRMPKIGETILGKSFALGPGGKGSNQAVAAARAGADVDFVSRLGRDTFGEMALSIWKDAGVTPKINWRDDEATGSAAIFVDDATGNNGIIICPGAAGSISVDDVQRQSETISQASVFMTQLEQPIEAALEALRIARHGGAITILNPAPAAQIPPEMVALSDFVTPNETEVEALTGLKVETVDEADRAAKELLSMGAGAALITLGENGSYFRSAEGSGHFPAMSAGALVETTGAGDAYNGGLAAALASGAAVETAIRFATATAAISVTRPGTAPSMPTRQEIDMLLAKVA